MNVYVDIFTMWYVLCDLELILITEIGINESMFVSAKAVKENWHVTANETTILHELTVI